MFAGEENSRVQAHIDGEDFSAHILTDEAEYNVEVTISCKIIVVVYNSDRKGSEWLPFFCTTKNNANIENG